MSSPTAASAAPIAVLVLAWDETTPAVRALIDATLAPDPSVASILVMVPQAATPEVLSAEEYLPISDDLLPASPEPEPPTAPSTPPPAVIVATPALPTPPAVPLNSAGELPPPAPGAPLPSPAAAPAPLGWSARRIIRLGNLSLPELARRAGQPLPAPIWLGQPSAPAAPYLGATAAELPTQEAPAPAPLPTALPPVAPPAPDLLPVLALAAESQPPTPPPVSQELAAPLPEVAITAGDLSPLEAIELANFEQSSADLLADFEAPRHSEAGAQPTDWAEALASLRQPAVEEPAALFPTPPVAGASPASQPPPPAAGLYADSNLNFRIIQYARFAVPLVLAEEPYAAIYAPAWPTWLAAQELRRRTGWPLVVHVTDLAAEADEPLDTATSWVAELQRQALRRADVVLAETSALAQRLRHELGLPAGTVHAVSARDSAAIAQALHAARPRPAAGLH